MPSLAIPKPAQGWPFAVRLSLAISLLVLACGISVLWISQRSARREAERQAGRLFEEVSRRAVDQTRVWVNRGVPSLQTLQNLAESGALPLENDERLIGHLLATIKANESLSWISYADTNGRFVGVTCGADGRFGTNVSTIDSLGRTRLVETEVLPDQTRRISNQRENSGYDPRTRRFYTDALAAGGKIVWQEPYIFFGQNVPGITCSAALMRDGKPIGVMTIDFTLARLQEELSTLNVSQNSTVLVSTGLGHLVTAPLNSGPATNEPGGPATLPTLHDTDPLIADAVVALGDEKPQKFKRGGKWFLIATRPFPVSASQQWRVTVAAPADDFLEGMYESQHFALLVCLGALLLAMLIAAGLARRVSRPVNELVTIMGHIGDGDLDAKADVRGAREFRQLSRSLTSMVTDLRDGLRLRHSINIARQVQTRLLPERPPVVQGLDVAGHSDYCDETGGDYYDFLITDPAYPDRLTIVVGDVMGHGVGSALVMAAVRAVLRDRIGEAVSSAHVLDRLNAIVGADMQGQQFMTMSLGTIDAAARTYRFASAGHDPAIIYRAITDSFEEVDEAGLPLGVANDGMYVERTGIPLHPGDILLIGTDGVWETRNAQDEEFGKDRLRDILHRYVHAPSASIAKALIDDINRFRGVCPFRDDVTFLLVKITPAEPHIPHRD